MTHVPSGEWGRVGGFLPCMQWGTLTDTCPQWGMSEEKRISSMYEVGEAQCDMSLVGEWEESRISTMYVVVVV